MNKIGFIGCGNMASAMISGLTKSEEYDIDAIYTYDIDLSKVKDVINEYGVNLAKNNRDLVEKCDVVFLTVKPDIYQKVILEIRDVIDINTIVINVAAGISVNNVTQMFLKEVKVVKAMPNTPSKVGEGITGINYSSYINETDKELVENIFNSFGKVVELEENQFDAFTSICGSSPAFVYMFIDAIAEAGIIQGIPRELAYEMVSQAVLGAAKTVIETKENPETLKNNVCTVGGATIEGVTELEKNDFKDIVIKAVIKTGEKSKKMNS